MRPNQNNNNNNNKNRQRGRNNNGGRKHVNPLSRNFESNGPDVKVRGNAAHVAEKYLQLARDAQSSGDPVLAENYLQHAEHYFRIVAAAQTQSQGQNLSQFRPDQSNQMAEFDDDDDFPPINDRFASPEPRVPFQPQPSPQGEQQMGGASESDDGEQQDAQPNGQGEPAAAEDGQSFNAQGGEGNGEGRRHRERNRRRRGRGTGGDQPGNGDPSNAPQPDVGELPAFLTAGTPTTPGE
ncbi:MAG: DUF4167 domain-containing protein [Devosia sp.]